MKVLGKYDEVASVSSPLVAQLPRLVRRQRRLEKLVGSLEKFAAREKATREAIDKLLVAAGVPASAAVLCLGYEVAHNERAGRTSINADKLRGAGVAELDIQFATDTGKPALFATVRPAKGSQVQ